MDRGGLFHFNHNMFMLITSMELQILKQFHKIECRRVNAANISLRENVIPLILAGDDVQVYWSIISASWEPEVEKSFYQ